MANQSVRLLLKHCKDRLRRAIRRSRSLEQKMEDLFHRSPDVRRWVAYREADRRNSDRVRAYEQDLSYYALKESDGE